MDTDLHPLRKISIHALREEGDPDVPDDAEDVVHISIHALREEGDFLSWRLLCRLMVFLSTPSARRATRPTLPPVT